MKKLKAIILTFIFMLTLSVPVLAKVSHVPNANTPKSTLLVASASIPNYEIIARVTSDQPGIKVAEVLVNGVSYEILPGDLYISPNMDQAYLNTTINGQEIYLTWDVNKHEAIREKFELTNIGAGFIQIDHRLWSSYGTTPVSGTINNNFVSGYGFCVTSFIIYQEIR
jgi:hypothetical protein